LGIPDLLTPRFRPQIEMLEERLAPASFVVTTTANSGAGSLRAAVDAANAAGGSNTITIAPAIAGQTITLSSKDTNNPFAFGPTDLVIGMSPAVSDNLTIQGDPTSGITISGGGNTRIFGILGGSTLTVQYVTLTGGSVTGGRGGGSATNAGDVPGGGGAGMGGAIFVAQGGALNVVQSLLTGNTATGGAGGGAGVSGPRQGGAGGGSAAYAGGDLSGVGTVNGANAGGGGVAGPGQPNAGQTGGAGGLNEQGVAAASQPTANANGNNGTLGGGGGGAGSYGVNGGSGVSVSSGGVGGGGGGSWGQPNSGGTGGFGGGGGSGFRGGGRGGFGGGAGSSWDGTSAGPGFGGGASGGSGNQWGNGGGGGAGMGGAIFNNGGTVNISNSTLAGNRAIGGAGGADGAGASGQAGSGGSGFGGAIFNRNGTLTILNSTIGSNTVTGGAGGSGTNVPGSAGAATGRGVFDLGDGAGGTGTVNVTNTIFGYYTDLNAATNAGGSVTVTGSTNLIHSSSGFAPPAGFNFSTGNPLLGTLSNNGGPTQTVSLLPGSLAIGNANVGASPAVDQRNFPRPNVTGPVDIGALQVSTMPSAITLVSSANPAALGAAVTFTAAVTLAGTTSMVAPQGTVTFFDGTTALATVALTNSVATFSTSSLTAGTHKITATYNVAANFPVKSSTSAPVNEVIVAPPKPIPPPNGIIATGTDAGIAATVNVFDANTGALKFTLQPFGSFSGGVRVAVGDVNGDGVPDVICAAGPGGAPLVEVFDGNTAKLIRIFFAFGVISNVSTSNGTIAAGPPSSSLWSGGLFVAAGDFTGKGYADIVIGADKGGSPQVEIIDGMTLGVVANFYAFNAPQFRGGVRVGVGDVNGDGIPDIILGAGPGASPQVELVDGRSIGQGTFTPLGSFFAFGTPFFTGGVYVAGGDITGAGYADIIVGAGSGGGPQVQIYDGKSENTIANFFAFPANFTGGARVGTVDPSGIGLGKARIATAAGPSGGPQVTTLDASLNMISSFFAFPATFPLGVFVS
jgi:hypothetical protein